MKADSVRVLLCGAGFSGNMGAEAMYDSIIEGIRNRIPEAQFAILSKYPKDDYPACVKKEIQLFSFPTTKQVIRGFPFYLFARLLQKLHVPYQWLIGTCIMPFFEYDILVDASGIAFSSDRSFSGVVINSLWFFPAFVSGIPIVKVSQSLGPYDKKYVRLLAKFILSKMDVIVCRGNSSYECTSKLLTSKHIYNLPDVAINLPPAVGAEAFKLLEENELDKKEYVVIGPSFVMKGFLGDSYNEVVCRCIYKLKEIIPFVPIVLIPHSRRHSAAMGVDSTNDDFDVCKEIAQQTLRERNIHCMVIDRNYSAHELKTLIGNAYAAIGSRFHFLVAALSSGVPSVALGWSHKYKELFAEFGVERFVREYHDFNEADILAMIDELINHQQEIRREIISVLPNVKKESDKNMELIQRRILLSKGADLSNE